MMGQWVNDDRIFIFGWTIPTSPSGLQHFPWETARNIKLSEETNLHILGILLLALTAWLVTHSRGRSRAARHRCGVAGVKLLWLCRRGQQKTVMFLNSLILHGKFHYTKLCWYVWLDNTNLVRTLIYMEKTNARFVNKKSCLSLKQTNSCNTCTAEHEEIQAKSTFEKALCKGIE